MSTKSNDNDMSRYCAFIGIDWADKNHEICLREYGSDDCERMSVVHSPEKLGQWILDLGERFKFQPLAVTIETSKGPLINFLKSYSFLTLFQVNPLSLSQFRKSFRVSSAKDDGNDAELLCEMAFSHLDRLRVIKDDDEQTKELAILSEQRRHIVEEKKRMGNQLKTHLKQYYPLALEVIGEEIHSNLSCEFLLRFPTYEQARAASAETLEEFYKDNNCCVQTIIDKRIDIIKKAQPLTTEKVLIESLSMLTEVYSRQLLYFNEAIKEHDKKIADKMSKHIDNDIFTSFPGAGDVLAPRLLSAFGVDRDKFTSSDDVQKLNGIAPIIIQSGQMKITLFRRACPKYNRQSFIEFAGCSVRYSIWAKAFFDLQRSKGKSYQTAIRALAFRWIRIMYKCWKDHKPYDELTYLKALQKRRSPLIKHLAVVG